MTENDGRRIDTLVNAVGMLTGTVESMTRQWASQEQYAVEGRQITQDKLESLSREIGNISSNVRMSAEQISTLKTLIDNKILPTIDEYKSATSKRDGILMASRFFWTGIVAIVGAIAFAVSKMLDLVFHGVGR